MGSVNMLEDEIAARKGMWRRQRQREADVEKRVLDLQQVGDFLRRFFREYSSTKLISFILCLVLRLTQL